MACPSGKVRFRDRIAADLALATIDRKAGRRRRERSSYPCPACRGWHLTSQPKRSEEHTDA